MQINKISKDEFYQVKSHKNELINLEKIELDRFTILKERLKASKEYFTDMKEYVAKNKEKLTEFSFLFKEHENYMKERIIYKFDSRLFKNFDYTRSVFQNRTDPSKEEIRKAVFKMVEEKHLFSGKLYQMMIIFTEIMKLTYETTTTKLRVDFHTKLKNRYFQFVNEEMIKVDNYYDLGKEDPAKEHTKIADDLRKTEYFKNLFEFNKLNVENITLFQKPEWNPYFFEETYEKNAEPQSTGILKTSFMNFVRSSIKNNIRLGNLYNSRILVQKKQHLIILVHGYHASHFDMRVYQNFLAKIIPHTIFLISKANEDMTKKKIGQMGKDLANEIKKYINESKSKFSKISFIGHSLGGVIIRTALPHLPQYKPYFFSFVSLSSPHLGCQQNKSSLVNIGMTFMDKFQKDVVISQLNMTDHDDPTQTFMYKLAQHDNLNLFNNVILVSSPQDSYVPYTSARIQPIKPTSNNKMDKAIFQMAKNIWNKVNNDMIVRIDVDLRSEKK
jgi:predicted alpha/beta hydrolase family esterase